MPKKILLLIAGIFSVFSLSAQNVNKKALAQLVQIAKDTHSAGLSIWIDGKPYKDYIFDTTDLKTATFSAQKSLISLAMGKLVTDGKLSSIDTPVYSYYPEWKQGLKKTVTIRHLLNHTSAIEFNESDPDGWEPNNIVQYSLCASLIDTPGHYFLYNDKAVNLLHGLIEKISGERMDQYITRSIFKRLGITDYRWEFDKSGNPSLLFINPAEFIKIGQLVINNGSWNGHQLISQKWLQESLSASQPFVPNCGLLWWLIPEKTIYVVDDELLEAFKQAGVSPSFVSKFADLKGTYDNVNIPDEKLTAVFGKDWKTVLDKELYTRFPVRAKRMYSDENIGYKAEGWLGQYIVIYPEKKIVACRMIKQGAASSNTELRDFEKYVYALIDK